MDHLRARLLAGELLVGTIVTLPRPEVAEILTEAGFDWLFIDAEHAPLDASEAQVLVMAAGTRCPCLVRVPEGDEVWLKKVLDIGAAGVIVPQVHSAEQAEQVVRLCKYPPQGSRGVGVARAHGYGSRFAEYVAGANDQVAVVIQAESAAAVRDIQAIAQVPGVDAVLIGPYDLSASLGRMGQVTHPDVTRAIATVAEACQEAGISLGVFGVDAEAVMPYVEKGFRLIAVGIDTLFLSTSAGNVLSALAKPAATSG